MRKSLEPGRFFLPGPTEVHPDVLAAQTGQMIGHRGRAIQELMSGIGDGLRVVFQTKRPVIVSTSSATGLMEAAIRSGVARGKVLSLVNGAFSARFAEIARSCGKEVEAWEIPWGEVHSPEDLELRLSRSSYQAVTLTHSETSTGALQELESIAEVVRAYPDTLLLVDSVTGIAGIETLPDDWGVDFILTGSQKALALPPGLSFGVASDAMLERARSIPDRGWYFDIERLLANLARDQTPATPAVTLLYALEVQLERILAEGMDARWKRHQAMQERLVEWVAGMAGSGVEIGVFAGEGHRSTTVSCLTVADPAAIVFGMAERGWVIGGGYGKIMDITIRIGHMGDHTVEGLDRMLDVLGEVVR
jgi:aspartate aminotransferase-like enzyme